MHRVSAFELLSQTAYQPACTSKPPEIFDQTRKSAASMRLALWRHAWQLCCSRHCRWSKLLCNERMYIAPCSSLKHVLKP